ncbi:Uncharacterized protein conserved in bacteria [Pragia fontium]|uniref:DUF2169 family type VI secretion system accessory protein n=1 Tax=Pragia fontium TaxID=82985 RepID=UPI000E00A6F4|nr:DUF2169 domain-containing protein [Pragia fontium]SUB81856.1 Uncharacterized protein conserved in bacteria [Pragia fontium]
MEFRNLSPFPALCYGMVDKNDDEHHVVLIKLSYRMVKHDNDVYQLKAMDDDPIPLCFVDEYWGEINRSSIKQESDLAPFKPLCDVIVNGTAFSPNGKSTTEFPIEVCLKDKNDQKLLHKKLMISGPRVVKNIRGLTSVKKITSLPVRYEYAFGGECYFSSGMGPENKIPKKYQLTDAQKSQHPDYPDVPIAHSVCNENTVGIGFMEKWYWKAASLNSIPVPQVEDPDSKISITELLRQVDDFNRNKLLSLKPVGLSTICRGWQPRLSKAGTYDQQWLEERHPALPIDFDFSYWNCAPEDQQIIYPNNGLKIEITNLTSEGKLLAHFPEHRPFILHRMESGDFITRELNLDTVFIDTDSLIISLNYRLVFPIDKNIRVTEARLEIDPMVSLIKLG